MGLLPSDLGSMDVVNWVPVDILSEIILELAGVVEQSLPAHLQDQSSCVANGAHTRKESQSEVPIYHAVNPHSVSWASLVPTVADLIGIQPGNIVPWGQWVDALRVSDQGAANPETNPGLKLLDFFESMRGAGGHGKQRSGGGLTMMPVLATEVSAAKSRTLASLHPVGSEWMALWVKQLGF